MTLASRLLMLVALALMPPLLFGIANDVSQRNERARALDLAVMAESRSVQDNLALVAESAHRMLIAVSEVPAIRAENEIACGDYLRAVSSKLEEHMLIAVADTRGDVLCNNIGSPRLSYSVADRAYFRRAMATGKFASGDLIVSAVTGRPSLHFALPLRSLRNTIDGVVVVSIDQEWLAQQLAIETVPRGTQITLFDPSGTIVAAAQDSVVVKADWVGQPASRTLLEALTVTEPRVVDIRGPDGILRRFGVVPADPALVGIKAAVGIDRERAFADLRAASLRNLLGLGLGGIVAVIAGTVISRRFVLDPLARIATAADRVGAGDLNARADLGRYSGELRELGAGFDRMIAALASREQERDNAEASLRREEARFEAIVNCIDQMVWSTHPDGRHDYYNQRWYDFTGTPPGSTDGPAWQGLVHPDDQAETDRAWHTALSTGEPYRHEYRLRHVSGRYVWVLGRAQAIRDTQGRIVRWYGTCTDIDDIVEARTVLAQSREALTREIAERTTELMAAEEQLRQSQKMEAVGQLTGGIAHDFNNMLQAIGGALELLVRRVDQNKLEDAKRFATVARATVDRAASLTHRLLAFARRQTLMPETLDVTALVDGMAELVARTVGPSIEISIRHASDPTWTVLCDLSQLENVVFNLCINARDAMPGGGKLIIDTANVALCGSDIGRGEGVAAGDYVEIAITDTGSGMDEATQARAFEPFFTTKPLGQGTGLGLSQVYGFVRQSGGFVRLESQPGHGTTVHLHLPRHDREQPDTPPVIADRSTSPVILLIEEDAEIREAAARNLVRLGYDVRSAAGGAGAMSLLASGLDRLDLLITTVGMQGNLNGRQIAESARQSWPALPVLFVTTYTGAVDDATLAPGMSIITKPTSPDELALRIRTLLALRLEPASDG